MSVTLLCFGKWGNVVQINVDSFEKAIEIGKRFNKYCEIKIKYVIVAKIRMNGYVEILIEEPERQKLNNVLTQKET